MRVGKSDKDLLSELIDRGYGDEERKRIRREQTEQLQARREQREKRKTRSRHKKSRQSSPVSDRKPPSVQLSDEPQITRMEDTLLELPASLRRRIDGYAYRNRYLTTGPWERLRSFFTILNPRLTDWVSKDLLRLLVGRPRGDTTDPSTSNLQETIDGLRTESRYLMGLDRAAGSLIRRPEEQRIEEQVPVSLRVQEPFLLEFLPLLAEREPMTARALEFTRVGYRQGNRIDVRRLVRVTKSVYKLSLILGSLSQRTVDRLIDLAATVNKAYEADSISRKRTELAAVRLKALVARLHEFRHHLFPVLLKTLVVYFPEEDLADEDNLTQIYLFVDLDESRILRFAGNRRSPAVSSPQTETTEEPQTEVDTEEAHEPDDETPGDGPSPDVQTFQERFKPTLSVLRRLFPESGIHRIDSWHFILPYFDLNVFNKDLTFPNQVQQLARTDPMAQIMVMHRIIDNLISSVDTYSLDEITEVTAGEGLTDLTRSWQNVYRDLFHPYLRELDDYARLAESGRMLHTGGARRLQETLGRIRAHAIRHLDRVIRGSTRIHLTGSPLYELVRRLSKETTRLKERLNTTLVEARDPEAVQMLAKMTQRNVLDMQVNRYKPTIERLSAYLKQTFGSATDDARDRSQLAFLEIFHGVAELYDWLLNDTRSYYRDKADQIDYAGLPERKRWASMRRIVQTEGGLDSARGAGAQLEKKASRESWVVAFAERFEDLQSGKESSFILLEIDGRTTLEDEGGEDLIGQTAVMVRRILADQTAHMVAVGRDRLLVAVPRGGRYAAVWAERWRRSQVERLKRHPLYGEILEQRDTGAKPLGTLSVGVADIGGCVSADSGLRRAEEALQAATESGNTTIVNQDGTLLLFEDFASRYIKKG